MTIDHSIIDEVRELDRRRIEAVNQRDHDALAALLAKDYRHCHANAFIQSAGEFIELLASRPRRIEPRDPEIRVYPDVAVLTGEQWNVVQQPDGETVRSVIWVTQVAERVAGEWKFVWFQSTRIGD